MFSERVREDVDLKWLEPHHAWELYRLVDVNRDHLNPWLPFVDGTCSPKDTEDFIRGAIRGLSEGREAHFGIWAHGKLAGVTGANTINQQNQTAVIGYWLGKDVEGRGIITAAVSRLLDDLVQERGLHRIEARCAAGNNRSRRVMERLGMRHEGTLKQGELLADGRWDDCLVYGILASEWKHRKGA